MLHADAEHGAPEIAGQVAAQVMNGAVRGAQAQGVLLDANVIMYGAMVAVDKTIDVMEGETGLVFSPDEVAQAFMKGLEFMYGHLRDLNVFSQREAQAVMNEIRHNPGAFDAEVMDAVGDDGAVQAMMRAMGDAPLTAVPEQDLGGGAQPQGGGMPA